MQGDQAGDAQNNGKPMPPVSSQFGSDMARFAGDVRQSPPFVGHPTITAKPLGNNDMPWEDLEEEEEEGTVEPVFEADVSETEAALAALSQTRPEGEFPLDAFIIPEHSQRVPTGVESSTPTEPVAHTPVTDLAERLEKLSHRLRVEESDAVLSRLATGDKLDAMLAGLLGGYLAGTK